jgi:hypothetical protein
MRTLRGGDERAILRLDYTRNTVDVEDAVGRLRAHKIPIKAVVMVPAYRAAAKFIEKTRDIYPAMIYTNVSFVGSTALAGWETRQGLPTALWRFEQGQGLGGQRLQLRIFIDLPTYSFARTHSIRSGRICVTFCYMKAT